MVKFLLTFIAICLSSAFALEHWCKSGHKEGTCYVKAGEVNEELILNDENPSSIVDVFFYRGETTLPKVRKGICNNFPNLERLFLWKSGVTEIEDGAFSNCENLKELHLPGNELEHRIFARAFRGLKKLNYLNLSSNRLTRLNVYSYKDTLPGLKLININDNDFTCTKLSSIYDALVEKGIQTAADLDPLSNRTRTGMSSVHDILCYGDSYVPGRL